jgi:hypothetical protein
MRALDKRLRRLEVGLLPPVTALSPPSRSFSLVSPGHQLTRPERRSNACLGVQKRNAAQQKQCGGRDSIKHRGRSGPLRSWIGGAPPKPARLTTPACLPVVIASWSAP